MIDELGESLIETVRSVRPHRLFLDGMEGFERAADFPERMSHVYSAIAQELERLGMTTLYTTETRELFASTIEVPITGLSAATQNIILLRHVEHRAAMLRVLAILKVRDDDYDATDARASHHRRRHPPARHVRRRVRRGIRRRSARATHASQRVRGVAWPRRPTSILIVDDEFGLAEMLREMLRESGFEVTLAINGRLALEILGRGHGRPGADRHDDAGDGRRGAGRGDAQRCEASRHPNHHDDVASDGTSSV